MVRQFLQSYAHATKTMTLFRQTFCSNNFMNISRHYRPYKEAHNYNLNPILSAKAKSVALHMPKNVITCRLNLSEHIHKHLVSVRSATISRMFHTSSRRPIPLPAILAVFIKSVVKIGAAITGRSVRLWYRRLEPEEKKKVTSSLKKRWYIFPMLGLGLLGTCAIFYYSHLKTTPITERQRFIIFTQEQVENISDAESKQLEEAYESKFYAKTDVPYLRVVQIARKLIEANPELQPFEKWKINVVKDPLVNAVVLPNGSIFVFDGILQLANTQDQLAIVLGHEMAHNVLGHAIEELSYGQALDVFIISCIAALWLFIPLDSIALVAQWLQGKIISLTTKLPHSRQMEKEADKVGLMFASRACYDVREGSILWQKMSINQKLMDGSLVAQLPEWIQTHPDSLKRAQHLDFLQPQAIEWRKEMKCSALPDKDPRDCFKAVTQEIENAMIATKTGQNLTKVPSKISKY